MTKVTTAEAADKLAEWHKLMPVYDYTVEFTRTRIANEAPRLVDGLLDHARRLEYLLGRLVPTDCTCATEGPDGIECLRCEVQAVLPSSEIEGGIA